MVFFHKEGVRHLVLRKAAAQHSESPHVHEREFTQTPCFLQSRTAARVSRMDVPYGFPRRAEARLIPAAAFISGGRSVKRGCRIHVLSGKNEFLCVQERKSREGTSSQPSSVICFLQFSGQSFYAAFSAIVEKDSRYTKILLSRRLFAGRFQICAGQVLTPPWQGGDAAALAGGGLCSAVVM